MMETERKVKTPRRTPEQLKKHREHMRQCRLLDPEKFRARQREFSARPESKVKRRTYTAARPRERLFSEARRRAREQGITFSITIDDVVIPEFCPVLGVPIDVGGKQNNWPSIDRHDPKLGYVPGNVAVISFRANRIKNDGTLAEFESLVDYMRGRS